MFENDIFYYYPFFFHFGDGGELPKMQNGDYFEQLPDVVGQMTKVNRLKCHPFYTEQILKMRTPSLIFWRFWTAFCQWNRHNHSVIFQYADISYLQGHQFKYN